MAGEEDASERIARHATDALAVEARAGGREAAATRFALTERALGAAVQLVVLLPAARALLAVAAPALNLFDPRALLRRRR